MSRRQTVFFLPIDQETQIIKSLNILTSLYHVERDTCTVHGRSIKTRLFWVDIDLAIKGGLTFYQTRSNAIILQGTLPAYCIPKVVRLKTGEVFYEKDHTCFLDHHQRSHLDTITIGQEGMINWVLQLNNSQSGNSFNSLLEKHHVLNSPNQPNPNPNQSVIDRGNLRTQKVFLWIKEKRPVHTRSMINVCTKNFSLQIDRGNLRNCLKDIRVKHAHDGTGEPLESSSSNHT